MTVVGVVYVFVSSHKGKASIIVVSDEPSVTKMNCRESIANVSISLLVAVLLCGAGVWHTPGGRRYIWA